MFSSFSSFSLPFNLPRIFSARRGPGIDIRSVEVHDVEVMHEKRARTLKHLLKLNHVNHSIVYHDLQFHNHMPHILGSAYILGAPSEHLNQIYEKESDELEPWHDSPGEVSKYDWRDYLGHRQYQRAYVDFFEDELVLKGYDWRKVTHEYLFQGKEPLINCVIAGLGHPLIHLGYAFEISSRELAMEALGLVTTSYNFLHKYLDDSAYSKPSTYSTSSPLDILQQVSSDKRFDGLFEEPGADNIEPLFQDHEDAVMEHWNAWHISDPVEQFKDSQYAATALLVATQEHSSTRFDFFLVHLLTTSHAVRILIPFIPPSFHVALVRQWWLLTLAVYIAQLRPHIKVGNISDYDLKGKDWKWLEKQAVESKWSFDAHYVKAIRAMKEAAKTWGDKNEFYLKAAVRFGEAFDGWGGFAPSSADDVEVATERWK
ncbi:MAG: hypothetical protein M1830_004180 [Pleopsidium flavum]|nr:MAG: hypothetical protein M1830_004180 [Pleopsidium flavum]